MVQMSNPFLAVNSLLPTTTPGAGNIITGGQLGFGNNLPDIDAATPLVMRPIVGIVTHAPTMFTLGSAGGSSGTTNAFTSILKALIETQCRSMDGIDIQYTL